MKRADHPVSTSAAERKIIDGGARYLPTRKPFSWSQASFTLSPGWADRISDRHTAGYRIWWCGPDNDRDHVRW